MAKKAEQGQFGEVSGYPAGSTFADRGELAQAAVHRAMQAGIVGGASSGAESIVLSGGYVDDVDNGDEIIYTGQGGRDAKTGKQIADQTFDGWNRALAKSCDDGLPVRVVRQAGAHSAYAPPSGLRYDGLYRVESYWHEPGKDGFIVYRYRLERIDPLGEPFEPVGEQGADLPAGNKAPKKVRSVVQRIVRSTKVSLAVKDLYGGKCQFCGTVLVLPTGAYSEGAHVRPLGIPHLGPDEPENVLSLCANCHVRFDRGALYVSSEGKVCDAVAGIVVGELIVHKSHKIGSDYLQYHRERIAKVQTSTGDENVLADDAE